MSHKKEKARSVQFKASATLKDDWYKTAFIRAVLKNPAP